MADTQVTLYTTPSCVFCHMVKEYLKSRKVLFNEVDVWADQEAARTLMAKTGMAAVPVTEIGEEAIVGFDRQRIDDALRAHKLG